MTGQRIAYHFFAVLRVVPHVWTGAYGDVGVIVHARTAECPGFRALTDAAALRERVPDVDLELLERHLAACSGIARGEAAAGLVALLPPSERFHWLAAPRSAALPPVGGEVVSCRARGFSRRRSTDGFRSVDRRLRNGAERRGDRRFTPCRASPFPPEPFR
jgi:hypothetical protein